MTPAQLAAVVTQLDTLAATLPTTPGLDCYVLGCREQPYLTCRHKDSRQLLTCRAHDPARWGLAAPTLYPWWQSVSQTTIAPPDGSSEPQAGTDADAERSELALYRAVLRQLLGLPAQDDDSPSGGKRVLRPTPPKTGPHGPQGTTATIDRPIAPTRTPAPLSAPTRSLDDVF